MSMDFSSWPREQEQTFVVYEQTSADIQKKAWTFSIAAGAVLFLFMVGVYMGVAPHDPHNESITKDMNMSNLTKKSKDAAPAPAPTPAPAAAPEAEKPAAPAEGEKPAE